MELGAAARAVVRREPAGLLDGLVELVLGQIGTEDLPVVAAVSGREQVVRTEVDGARVVR